MCLRAHVWCVYGGMCAIVCVYVPKYVCVCVHACVCLCKPFSQLLFLWIHTFEYNIYMYAKRTHATAAIIKF